MEMIERGTLGVAEPHPAAVNAMTWVHTLGYDELARWREAFASCAIGGSNRLAEVCGETLDRLLRGDLVSDRYLLGLAWTMRYDMPAEVLSIPQGIPGGELQHISATATDPELLSEAELAEDREDFDRGQR